MLKRVDVRGVVRIEKREDLEILEETGGVIKLYLLQSM